jgi:hypothetical protein
MILPNVEEDYEQFRMLNTKYDQINTRAELKRYILKSTED